MTHMLAMCIQVLEEANFATATANSRSIVFEDDTVFGFVSIYDEVQALVTNWQSDLDILVEDFQFKLRRSGDKAWNAYAILISTAEATHSESVVLSAIEENLIGVRKIARSGMRDVTDVRSVLLPLLPLQSAPKLDAVDMDAEIRLRTTELAGRAVEAFLSNVEETVLIQVLEEEP